MSSPLDQTLRAELQRLLAQGLARSLPREPARGVDFTSNDYLGLARDPAIARAGAAALERGGAGGRASRLLGGGDGHHLAAEEAAAKWLGAEAALLFPSGYQANLAVVGTLVGPGDAVLSDRWNHASLIDAARLSRAQVLVHGHCDLAHAEALLRSARGARRRLVLTEGVFSMDGDRAPVADLLRLCERHDAWLLVDEAHSIGLLGPAGAGAAAEVLANLAPAVRNRLAARVLTGGKSLGVGGAFVVGSKALVDTLVQRARGFVFSTAPSPAIAGALVAAIERVRGETGARQRCLAHAKRIARELQLPEPAAAIVPLVIGSADAAVAAAARLAEQGFDVRAVRPPTVPDGTSRLRIVAHGDHSDEQVAALIDVCRPLVRICAVPAAAPKAGALVVVGTDTGVGKTVVSALVVAALRAHGPVVYWKPVQTGDDDDTAEVARLAELGPAERMEPLARYALPASPHEAAAAEGKTVPVETVWEHLEQARRERVATRIVVELAGGLLVPYDDRRTQADWLASWRPPVLLVARSGLGTLNHTLLTAEALAARGIVPFALVLVGPPHRSNRETLAARLAVPVLELPPLDLVAPEGLGARVELAPVLRDLGALAAAAAPRGALTP